MRLGNACTVQLVLRSGLTLLPSSRAVVCGCEFVDGCVELPILLDVSWRRVALSWLEKNPWMLHHKGDHERTLSSHTVYQKL